MEKLLIRSHGSKCLLIANEELVNQIRSEEFLYHYIPDVEIGSSDEEPDVEFEERPGLVQKAVIEFPRASFVPGVEYRGVISAMDYLLERVRQERYGIYCLNSATASRGKSAVTFWGGATNLGKTSSMLELVMERGFEFYADERTLLDLNNRVVVGGSRTIANRKQVLKERTGESGEFHNCAPTEGSRRLDLMIYPHIDHGLARPIVYQFSPKDFRWLLLREFGVNIRGAIKYLDDYTYPLPSIDTQSLAEKRTSETRRFTERVPCYYFQGSLSQVASFVEENFKKNAEGE
jgi:hypothetical protein